MLAMGSHGQDARATYLLRGTAILAVSYRIHLASMRKPHKKYVLSK